MALIEKLNAIGDAIRAKTGGTEKLTLDAMPTEIAAIETGGGGEEIPEEVLLITGNCSRRFANNSWNSFIDYFGDRITSKSISAVDNMFANSTALKEIPFDINCKSSSMSLSAMFNSCEQLTSVPRISCQPNQMDNMFYNCLSLRNLPEDFGDSFNWTYFDSLTNAYQGNQAYLFRNCWSLRSVPMSFLAHANPALTYYSYSCFYYGFQNCHCLDELVGLPIPYTGAWTSNFFYNTFDNCYRLKNLTFEMPDGAPKVVSWKSQTIDLSKYVGYTTSSYQSKITDYNSGITADKLVSDDISYQALKDDPDWYTTDIAYSRYNHDSAVATINSLPDTSAYLATQSGATNTIKFKGGSGAYTNGSDVATGGVEYLTEEEIAVAAAKGWTVSIV